MNNKIKKYAELLLKCVKVEDKHYLFIEIPDFLRDFGDCLEAEAKKYHLREVHMEYYDSFKKHDLMKSLDQDEINRHPLFNREIYNKYAKLDAAFLFITSSIPDLMSDIPLQKIKDTTLYVRSTQKYFRDLYETDKLNWCIAAAANDDWALAGVNVSTEELWNYIFDICLINEDDPYQAWIEKLNKLQKRADKLNEEQFVKLHYKNELGTDLTIYLPENHTWCSGISTHGSIANVPTEEIFTSPIYDKTEGIVYATKPLVHGNATIEDFSLEFKDGKVINFEAKNGKDILESIITLDEYAAYLGECALVDYDSPINNTNMIFKETLFDENASCHLALGSAFNECLKEARDYRGDDLRKVGLNSSNTHVDFMIGSPDLVVEGEKKDGTKKIIMDKGNFVL